VTRSIGRATLAVWQAAMEQKSKEDAPEEAEDAQSQKTRNTISDAYHRVFSCGHSPQSPLGPRVGSMEDPAQIELSCNCIGPSRMLKWMNQSGRLRQHFDIDVRNLGMVTCQIEEIERVAVDFAAFEESEMARDFHDSPSIAVEGMTGRYRLAGGSWKNFTLKARIRTRPFIMPRACFSDSAAQGIFDSRNKIEILDATPFDFHRPNFIRELSHRQFIYLVAFDARVTDRSGGFLAPDTIRGNEGETVDIFRYATMSEEHKIVFSTMLTSWAGHILPLPLIYDPWFGLGGVLLDVRCEEGWIAMRRNYLLSDLGRYNRFRGLN
jgi:hypothetical protein